MSVKKHKQDKRIDTALVRLQLDLFQNHFLALHICAALRTHFAPRKQRERKHNYYSLILHIKT